MKTECPTVDSPLFRTLTEHVNAAEGAEELAAAVDSLIEYVDLILKVAVLETEKKLKAEQDDEGVAFVDTDDDVLRDVDYMRRTLLEAIQELPADLMWKFKANRIPWRVVSTALSFNMRSIAEDLGVGISAKANKQMFTMTLDQILEYLCELYDQQNSDDVDPS